MNTLVAILYIFGNLFLASVLGSVFVFLLKRFDIPRVARFLIGFSLLPYILGIFMLLVTVIPFRMPNPVYVALPYVIAVLTVCIVFKKNKISISLDGKLSEFYVIGLITALLSGACCSEKSGKEGFVITAVFACVLMIIAAFLMNRFVIKKPWDKVTSVRIVFDMLYVVLFLLTVKFTYVLFEKETVIRVAAIMAAAALVFGILYMLTTKNEEQLESSRYLMILEFFNVMLMINRHVDQRWGKAEIKNRVIIITVVVCLIFFLLSHGKGGLKKALGNGERIVLLMSSVLLLIIIRFCMIQGMNAVIGSDAIQYLSESLDYCFDLQFGSMNDFHGNATGTLLSNIHNPIWPAYLSNGLLYSATPGYPHDVAARLSFSMTFIYLLSSILALGITLRNKLAGVLSCCIWFANQYVSNLLADSTRDCFRMSPLVCFAILLTGMPRKVKAGDLTVLAIITAFIMAGHPINAITAIAIVGVYLVWYLVNREGTVYNLLLVLVSGGLGALAGSYQIVWAYLETGHMTGGLIDFEEVLSGTSYYDTYVTGFTNALGSDLSYPEKLLGIIHKDSGWIFIPALVVTVFLIIALISRRKTKSPLFFVTLIAFAQFLMLTDLFRWSGRTYVEWCYKNYRYTMQMYIFYAVLISVFIAGYLVNNKFKAVRTISVVLVFAYLWIPMKAVCANISENRLKEDCIFPFDEVNSVIDSIEPGKILLDNYNMNYYLDDRGICFWTQPVDSLRHADSDEDFYSEASKLGIKAILITESYREIYWNGTEMDRFISSDYIDREVEVLRGQATAYTIYILK